MDLSISTKPLPSQSSIEYESFMRLIHEISANPALKSQLEQALRDKKVSSDFQITNHDSNENESSSESESDSSEESGNLVEKVKLGLASMSTKIMKKNCLRKKGGGLPKRYFFKK